MEDKIILTPKTSKDQACANCGTPYTGNYCPNCGQSNTTYNKPFRFIVADFAGNIFAFDTRLWNTLKTIFIKPGKIAKDMMAGKRERYMPPFRLYVFVSFIFFLMLNYSTAPTNSLSNSDNAIKLTSMGDSLNATDSATIFTLVDSTSLNRTMTIGKLDEAGDSLGIDIKDIIEHPKRYYSQFLRWASTAMFFLMPFYGFLLWLFFRKTETHYFGHLILAVNQHVFTFLLMIVLMLIEFFFPENESSVGSWIALSIPIYYFLGAYRLYQRKWSTTLMRLFVVGSIYGIVTFAALLFIIGVTVLE